VGGEGCGSVVWGWEGGGERERDGRVGSIRRVELVGWRADEGVSLSLSREMGRWEMGGMLRGC